MTADLLVDRPRPGVLHLRLNRPSKLNAITDSMLDDLSASLAAAESDTAVRAVVLSGGSVAATDTSVRAWRSNKGAGRRVSTARRSVGTASRARSHPRSIR